MKLYQCFSNTLAAKESCANHNNHEWFHKHMDLLGKLTTRYMPSGSGFDEGTILETSRSTSEKLVFSTKFHHMNDTGYYNGWTYHEVIVTPSLQFGLLLTIRGVNRNDIKDYIHECFEPALNAELEANNVYEQLS